MSAVAEVAQYGRMNAVEGGPETVEGWVDIFTELLPLLISFCPKKFQSEEDFQAAHDKEYRHLMLRGKRERCPLPARLHFKKKGIKGKGAQDDAWFRAVTASSGYTLAELSAG